MAEIQFNVNMDLVDKYTPAEDITIPQEDNLSVKFTYSIFNREVAEDLTGATDIVVSFVKPDGHIVLQSNGTLVLPNKVNIVANAQAFTYVGKVYMQVQYKKAGQTFNTRQAFFWVERSNTSCQTVASADFAPYLDSVVATGEMLNGLDLQALIDSKQTAEGAQADVNGIKPRVVVLETNVASLTTRVTAAETKNTQQDSRLTSLENQQGTFSTNISNLQTSDTAQNTRLTNLESEQTTQDNRLTNIESKNATQDNNIGNNATAISGLQTSQATQDTKIANLESYQTSSSTRITAVEAKNTTQDSRLLTLEQAQPDLAPINSRLTAVETKNTAQDASITALETAKTANDTKNTQQDSRLTALENGASSLSTTVVANKTAQDTVNTNTNNSLTALTTRVTATETKNAQQDTRLDTAEAKNTSQDAKIATLEGANSVIIADIDALESSVGGHEVRLDDNDTKNSSQDSLIASNTSVISSLTTTVNSNQTGMNSRVTTLETAKTANDTKNTQQDSRLTNLENQNATQDTRLTAVEDVNSNQGIQINSISNKANSNESRLNKIEITKTFVGDKLPVTISHSGLNYVAPINTIPSFELAAESGYKYIEMDLKTTFDNKWVVFHDDSVDDITDGTGLLSSKTLIEVKNLNIDISPVNYPDTKIPTLEEALDFCKKFNCTPVIEVKTYNNDTNLNDLLSIITSKGMLKECIIMAFGSTVLTKIRAINKDVKLCVLTSTATQADIDYVKSISSDYVTINKSAITKEFCDLAHQNEIKVGAWTTDSEDEIVSLLEKGVDIITTNSIIPREV